MSGDGYGGADALAVLGAYGDVGGADYVGAGLGSIQISPQAAQHVMAAVQQQQQAKLAQAGRAAISLANKVQHDRKVRNAALSGFVPMFDIPMSTAAGVTIAGGGALFLAGAPGVPCRPLRYVVSRVTGGFFGLSSIAAGRFTMISGGAGLVPADSYLPDSTQSPLDFPKLGAGSPIVITGANLDAVAHPYVSAFKAVDNTQSSDRLM